MQDFDVEVERDHRYDDGYDEDHFVDNRPRMASPRAGSSSPSHDQARREAARRRRTILLSLVGVVIVTMLGGFVASFLWDVTILAVIALVAYVALMAWAATHAPSSSSRVTERHIAHATSYEQEPGYSDQRAYFDDDVVDVDSDWDAEGDGWWDQPRRAAAR